MSHRVDAEAPHTTLDASRGGRSKIARHPFFDGLMTLFAGPFVLAALMFSIVLFAFNVWPTFHRFSEWGD